MCLIAFHWQPDSEQRLLLASNRDEFYERPSLGAAFWPEQPAIFGGKDLKMGGTWLAISRDGRLAAVTNFRSPDTNDYPRSRGEIPTNFLLQNVPAMAYAEQLSRYDAHYAGYNALLFDGENLVYTSNRNPGAASRLKPGIFGLSNHLLDTPWPKLQKAKHAISQASEADSFYHRERILLRTFSDTETAPEHALPDTGVGQDIERLLSAMFIKSAGYGTRSTTVIQVCDGTIDFTERSIAPLNGKQQDNKKPGIEPSEHAWTQVFQRIDIGS